MTPEKYTDLNPIFLSKIGAAVDSELLLQF